jgi:hypothetical protein
MSFISDLASGGVEGVLKGVGGLAKDLRSAITGEMSPEAKAELEQKLLELEFAANQGQLSVNLQEAKHPSIWVSGWRPAIGWICATGIGYSFVVQPFLSLGLAVWAPEVKPPMLAWNELMTLVMALLGFGSMRTFEKIKGVSRN